MSIINLNEKTMWEIYSTMSQYIYIVNFDLHLVGLHKRRDLKSFYQIEAKNDEELFNKLKTFKEIMIVVLGDEGTEEWFPFKEPTEKQYIDFCLNSMNQGNQIIIEYFIKQVKKSSKQGYLSYEKLSNLNKF